MVDLIWRYIDTCNTQPNMDTYNTDAKKEYIYICIFTYICDYITPKTKCTCNQNIIKICDYV